MTASNSIFTVILISLPLFSSAQDLTYKNDRCKYTINYYTGWRVKEADGMANIYAPIDGIFDDEFESVGISVGPAKGQDVDALYSFYTKDFPTAFVDYHVIDSGEWQIDGVKAKWMETTKGMIQK